MDTLAQAVRLVLVRHGQTAWNAEQRLQGHQDIALDAHGLWQADRLAEALIEEGIQHLYSSDSQRAQATLAPLAQRLGLPIGLDQALRERSFGQLEGLTHAQIEAQHPQAARQRRQRELHAEPGGGESLLAFHGRCVGALNSLLARHPGQVVAVASHGGVLDCVYRAAVGLSLQAPRSWSLDNATVNRLLWTQSGFVLVGWNDAGHLAQSE